MSLGEPAPVRPPSATISGKTNALLCSVLEATRTRIIELEDEIVQHPHETSWDAPDASSAAGPSAASVKADEKRLALIIWLGRLKQDSSKSDAVKFRGSPKTRKGLLTQPALKNKPKGTHHRLILSHVFKHSPARTEPFIGDELKPLPGGGMPARTFGRGFGGLGSTSMEIRQDRHAGVIDVAIRWLDVNYPKNNKCTFKFKFEIDLEGAVAVMIRTPATELHWEALISIEPAAYCNLIVHFNVNTCAITMNVPITDFTWPLRQHSLGPVASQ
ncbi:hypothetical protein FPV67DRAFT_1673631 [Lyophyllum atratum]|nr:hypothetical protein FPV67DRAFT_1673631 [Lyophyllum atratum]